MLLPKFEFHEPTSIKAAVDLKHQYGGSARWLAGGTDLLVHLKKKLMTADHIIDLGQLDDLAAIRQENDTVFIGACATMAQLSKSPIIQDHFGALKSGGDNLGTHLIRNRATIGGNACNASPAGDTLCALLVYNATAVLQSRDENRDVAIDKFFAGPGKTVMNDNELLTGFRLPLPSKNSGAHYIQLGKRKSSEINVVNVASFLEIDPATQTVADARIALGSVAATPIRSLNAEALLKNKSIDDALFYEAGETARHQDCKPIDDFRGSASYRRAMIGVLTKRTLSAAFEQAKGA